MLLSQASDCLILRFIRMNHYQLVIIHCRYGLSQYRSATRSSNDRNR